MVQNIFIDEEIIRWFQQFNKTLNQIIRENIGPNNIETLQSHEVKLDNEQPGYPDIENKLKQDLL